MKILFICGALEPGRDGVGDYTRRLAGAIGLMGHEATVIALYDPYVIEETIADQLSDGQSVHVLRIPQQSTGVSRWLRVQEWTNAFKPEWISLQFVPYAFHPKGMPFSLGRELQKLLIDGRRLQIMFHETWIGADGINLKRRLTAAVQKNIIRKMLKLLQPGIVHTQLPATVKNLETIVRSIKPLQLFSNIEVAGQCQKFDPSTLRAGFFSQADASPAVISFLQDLGRNAAASGLRLELLFIGGDPARMKAAGETLSKTNNFKNVLYSGFLPPEGISAALQSCTVGITLVPRHALGKSGSVAAFLQHGIPVAAPVIYPGIDPNEIGFFSGELCSAILLMPDLNALALAGKAAINAKNEIGLTVIAKIFIEDICSRQRNNS
ncbi:MAG: hypothetical protein ABJB86_05285 [Bacteroidota bacterium]